MYSDIPYKTVCGMKRSNPVHKLIGEFPVPARYPDGCPAVVRIYEKAYEKNH